MRNVIPVQCGSEYTRWAPGCGNFLALSPFFSNAFSKVPLRYCKKLIAVRRKPAKLILYVFCLLGAAISFSVLTAQAITYDIQKDWTLYGDLNQNSIPGIGSMACGPTAAVNSFVYLQNSYPDIYDHYLVPDLHSTPDLYENDELVTVAEILAYDYMHTDMTNGTWSDWFLYGKWDYIEENAPGSTIYAAQQFSTWSRPPVPEPSWVSDVLPTWSFLYDELAASEDVEILINGSYDHYLTLTSFYWDDIDDDGIIDGAEDAWIDYIDPWTGAWGISDIWHLDYGGESVIATNYEGGLSFITMAVGESPVPEPSTAVLLGLGLAALALRRRLSA